MLINVHCHYELINSFHFILKNGLVIAPPVVTFEKVAQRIEADTPIYTKLNYFLTQNNIY